jgi:PAS domain S-box-containing protein
MEIIKNSLSSTNSDSVADIKKTEVDLEIYIHFFNNTFDFNCIANVDGYFEIINPRFEKILGYSKKELLASRFLDFIYEDDINGTLNEIEKLKQGITTINFSNRYRKKDGNYIWLEWSSTSDVASGKIFAIARDITARKLAEEALNKKTEELSKNEKKFQDIFESLPGLYCILSPEFKIIAASNSYLKATMTKRNEILGRIIFDVFPDDPNDPLPSAVDNLKASFSRVLQTKLPDKMTLQEHEIRRLNPQDDYFEALYWAPYNSPVLDSNGNIIYIIHHVENITKRKKLLNSFENKLLQFQKNK